MEFDYREIDYENDFLEINELIRNNLNPDFTLEFLEWKHLKNPFGRSYGRVALHEEKIVGLRLFMFWEFIDTEGKIIRAIRPVDTVTDEKYRGRGLFKKLTLKGLEECSDRYEFIYNTPNLNSLPAYLKLGWEKIEDPTYFKLGVLNFFKGKGKIRKVDVKDLHFNQKYNSATGLRTLISDEFLHWRYSGSDYKAVIKEGDYSTFLIYKTIKMKLFDCIMIFEIYGEKDHLDSLLHSLGRELKVNFVYFLNCMEFQHVRFFKTFKRQQPVIVIKGNSIGLKEQLEFSLGDLEGKL